jgi:hypothetical protein
MGQALSEIRVVSTHEAVELGLELSEHASLLKVTCFEHARELPSSNADEQCHQRGGEARRSAVEAQSTERPL